MERTRRIAASPVRPASDTWAVIKTLLGDTLERSDQVQDGSVAAAMSPLDGLASALIASGHLASNPMVVHAGEMHLNIHAIRGDDAFTVEENLAPVPGGAAAPSNWKLYVPSPVHLREIVDEACKNRDHLVSGKPPANLAEASRRIEPKSSYAIDADVLRRIGAGS